MKIEHIALWVKNIEISKQFYCKYFRGIASTEYHNVKTNFKSYFIQFESGARVEIMNRPDIVEHKETPHFGLAHFAFSVGNREKVIAMTECLRKEGIVIRSEPRTTGDGYFESVILDPDENEIEITI